MGVALRRVAGENDGWFAESSEVSTEAQAQ